jgi:hypothetical protein
MRIKATVKYKPNLIDVIADWQRVEADTVRFAKKEIPNAKNMLTKTMLQVIELEAQKARSSAANDHR